MRALNLFTLFAFTCLFSLFSTPALSAVGSSEKELRIYDLSILDASNRNMYFPTMRQSMQLSNNAYWLTHNYLLDYVLKGRKIDQVSTLDLWPIYAFEFGLLQVLPLPLDSSWLHEEWHRAVLSQYDISSHNDVYNFKVGAESIAVSHVQDEDLVRLKKIAPEALVRLNSAGFEAGYEQVLELEKQGFYNNHSPLIGSTIFLNYFGNIAYMHGCTTDAANTETDLSNKEDGTDIPKRDFTGLDCTAWVYDLFRPDEPYEARGVHPSGVGINRYRKLSDLTKDEQKYLKKQRNLSLLNLIDPFLFGQQQLFRSADGTAWNATVRHELAPFGYDIAGNIFMKQKDGSNAFGSLHVYNNKTETSLGLDVTSYRIPVNLAGQSVYLTPRAFVWSQPEKQRFDASESKLGGLFSVQANIPLSNNWEVFGQLEGKTKGWVAGNDSLEKRVTARVGIARALEYKSRW